MKSLIFPAMFFLASNCYGQPGDLDISMAFDDSIKYIVTDKKRDTITANNIEDKGFEIFTYRDMGITGIPQLYNPPHSLVDSNGLVLVKDSATFDISSPEYKLRSSSCAWIIQIFHNNEKMRIYLSDLEHNKSNMPFVFFFTPGNYYLTRNMSVHYQDGKPITHTLISLDETQPDPWEGIFSKFQARQKLGL